MRATPRPQSVHQPCFISASPSTWSPNASSSRPSGPRFPLAHRRRRAVDDVLDGDVDDVVVDLEAARRRRARRRPPRTRRGGDRSRCAGPGSSCSCSCRCPRRRGPCARSGPRRCSPMPYFGAMSSASSRLIVRCVVAVVMHDEATPHHARSQRACERYASALRAAARKLRGMNSTKKPDMDYAIEATGLRKRYGDTKALDGVDLFARRGSVLGVLGPNGAGKTTAVRVLATLVAPDAGSARVDGYDVAASRRRCASGSASRASSRPSTRRSPAPRTSS